MDELKKGKVDKECSSLFRNVGLKVRFVDLERKAVYTMF
jgi:hypothetical protein